MNKRIVFIIAVALFVAGISMQAGAQVEVGQTVWAYWEETSGYYPGVAVQADSTIKGGGFLVVFFDGDSAVVPGVRVRPFSVKVGTKVFAKWTDGKYYPGKVAKMTGLGVFIKFDDGDELWTTIAALALEE